jgi:ABC-type nitrate/sulfonate/bicarbonate transport system substrate-binding protein
VNYPDIFVSMVNVFKRSWAKDNPELVLRLTKAQAEATRLFYDDKNTSVWAYRSFDRNQDEANVSRLYDVYKSREVLDRVPLLQKAAIASAASRMADDLPAIKTFDASTIIDMAPVRELIGEGYFRQLYGPGIAKEEQSKLASSY